jgi:osmoprotectant transport system permease protein
LIGGIGKRTAIIVLALYALLPIMRNMVVGILGVETGIRDSALAMGMTRQQILWRVEIPLALPTILAGLRIAIVSTIGTATVAAAIGGGGLGTFHVSRDRNGGPDDGSRRRRSRRESWRSSPTRLL